MKTTTNIVMGAECKVELATEQLTAELIGIMGKKLFEFQKDEINLDFLEYADVILKDAVIGASCYFLAKVLETEDKGERIKIIKEWSDELFYELLNKINTHQVGYQ